MTDNHGTQPADRSQERQPDGEGGEEPAAKPKKAGRRGVFDIYAAYNPKRAEARIGLSITIGRKPGNKR